MSSRIQRRSVNGCKRRGVEGEDELCTSLAMVSSFPIIPSRMKKSKVDLNTSIYMFMTKLLSYAFDSDFYVGSYNKFIFFYSSIPTYSMLCSFPPL